MGFFFTVAIFATITLKLFDKRIRYVIVIALYAMLLTSLSITAIVINVVMWMFYLIIMKKLKWWSIFIVAIVAVLLFSLYQYGIDHSDTPILGDFSKRIEEKFESAESGDMDDVTTNRTKLAKEHFQYYISSPFHTLLFGGIPVNPRYIYPDLKAAGHNEYIDMLLNIGILGAIIMLGYFFKNVIQYAKQYKKTKEDHHLCLIMIKMLWACYALSLTVFLDFRFMTIFLL